MLLLGAVAGVLSGCLWLVPNGQMGGMLGMSLAAGAIWLGNRQLKQGAEPTRRQIMQAGLVSGLLGGVLMAAVSQACAGMNRGEFGPPALPFWAPLVLGVLYGPVVQWGYSVRRSSSHPLGKALISTCLGCFVLKALATIFYILVSRKETDILLPTDIFLSLWISLLGAVPFALLWVLAMAWSDPAWPPPAAGARRLASNPL
jgi:hypothetical protein